LAGNEVSVGFICSFYQSTICTELSGCEFEAQIGMALSLWETQYFVGMNDISAE